MRFTIFIFLLLSAFANAQQPNKVEEVFEKFEGPFRVQGILEFPEYSFYLGGPAIQGVAYVPSFHPRLGPRILWKEIGLTATFALPVPEAEQRRRGDTQQNEVILNSYWRQNAIDLYYLRIRGFYIASPWQEFSVHKPERYPQVPDAVVSSFGFNWYYVFQPETYSLKAAFDQSEFQKESGGSWLISPFFNHFEMSLGTRFIRGIGDDRVTELPRLASGRFDSLGASFGYGYSLIYGRFFASLIGAVGPGAQYQKIGRSEDVDVQNLTLAVKINVNGSLGWNFKSYVGGFKAILDSLSSDISGTRVASNLVSGQLFFGARF